MLQSVSICSVLHNKENDKMRRHGGKNQYDGKIDLWLIY